MSDVIAFHEESFVFMIEEKNRDFVSGSVFLISLLIKININV